MGQQPSMTVMLLSVCSFFEFNLPVPHFLNRFKNGNSCFLQLFGNSEQLNLFPTFFPLKRFKFRITAPIARSLRCGYNVIMIPVLEDVAQELNIAPDSLWQESLGAYLARELRLTELDVADLQDRYGVVSSEELKAKIDSGDIYSHPAWEEMIEWENLVAYRVRLVQLQVSLA